MLMSSFRDAAGHCTGVKAAACEREQTDYNSGNVGPMKTDPFRDRTSNACRNPHH